MDQPFKSITQRGCVSIRLTERRNVPLLLSLHLWYVYMHFTLPYTMHVSRSQLNPRCLQRRGWRSSSGGSGHSTRCWTSQGRDASTSRLRPLWNAAAATVSPMMALPTAPSSPTVDPKAQRPSISTMDRCPWFTMLH